MRFNTCAERTPVSNGVFLFLTSFFVCAWNQQQAVCIAWVKGEVMDQ